jgi:DNA invertase Pin-like site-specific DNA recombinase
VGATFDGSAFVQIESKCDRRVNPAAMPRLHETDLDQQAIDTTTPMGKLVFQVTGAFAEFERSMIRQRVKAGLKRAVAQGTRLGRLRSTSPLNAKHKSNSGRG